MELENFKLLNDKLGKETTKNKMFQKYCSDQQVKFTWSFLI